MFEVPNNLDTLKLSALDGAVFGPPFIRIYSLFVGFE